jgi:hypothetical protein
MKRSAELRAGMLELGDAITALRRVSSLRGSQARNSEAFAAAGLAYGMAKSRLLPELRARGAQSLDMSAKISPGAWGPAAQLPHSLALFYELRDCREQLAGILASLGEPIPDDLPDPGFLERHLERVPRAALPLVPWLPLLLGLMGSIALLCGGALFG